MKKLTFSILSLIFLLCAAFGLVGCGKETHTHSFTKQKVEQQYLASEATCTESAKYYYSCTCGEKGTETFTYGNALGHSFGDWVIIKEPTETEKGFKTRSCTRYGCNFPENEEIPALAHTHKFTEQNADDKYLAAEATCTKPAQYYYSCSCGEKGTETFEYGNALGHSFGDWVIIKEPTETEKGFKTRSCTRYGCNFPENEEIPALAHTHKFTEQNADDKYLVAEATCTNPAQYYYSCICGEKGTETFTYGDALGHSFGDWVIIKEPTETEKGFKTRSCTRYGCNFPENEEIPTLAHTHKFTEQNTDDKYLVAEATCTKPAQYYYSCVCGEKGTETFTYGNALGHSFTNYVSDNNATCTEDGTKTATCDHIGCTQNNTIADENSKLGHSFTDYVSDGNATCTEDGTKTAKCDRCNAIDTVTDEGSAKGHSYSSKWEYNDTYHWQNSICGHEVKGNYAMHTPDESGFCTVCDQPVQATEGVVYDVSPSGEYAEVIDYTGTSKRINIADTYNSLPVQSIYDEAFKGKDVTYVIIPSSVKNIGVSAFYGCSGLTNITIPDSVTSIGDYAFYCCYSLTSVTIPDSVTSIGDFAFSNCSGLTCVTIGNGVTSIGDFAFSNCSGLTSITIPDSVTSIDDSAFEYCGNLKYNKYGNALYLGNPDNPYHALINAASRNYSSCEIHEKTKVLANNCFAGCIRLTSIVIPDSVTSIGNSAFCNCSGLTSVTIGNGITSMDYWAFYGCSGLKSVTIGSGVIYIGD